MKSSEGRIERYWTTSGGEFRLTCFNNSQEIQDISGLTLSLIHKQELPEFGVINLSPKGGHSVRRVNVELSDALGDFDLTPNEFKYLNTGESYNVVIDFAGIDPGIYYFQIQHRGAGGSVKIRQSPVYKIVYVPDPPPNEYVFLYEFWPNALLVVERLLSMSKEERIDKIGLEGGKIVLYRHDDGELRFVHSKPSNDERRIIPEMPYEPCDHPLSDFINARCVRPRMLGEFLYRFWQWEDWCHEWLDQSEPRGPLGRARLLSIHKADFTLIQDSILKAYERTPWHPKINIFLSLIYYELGYLGFCQFHLEVAYIAASSNPIIAGLHYLLMKKLKKNPPVEVYTRHLADQGTLGFHNLIRSKKFPTSLAKANELAFPHDKGMRETWSNQIW